MTRLGPPMDVRALFPEERAALLELFAGLRAEEWQAPTVATGWSVHDLALHLLFVDLGVLCRQRDGYDGRPQDAPAGPMDWDAIVAYVNGLNDAWLRGARRISPRMLVDLLRLTGGQLAAFYDTLDLDVPNGEVSWAGPGPHPVWLDVAREYTERWVHQQQIRDAAGRPGLTERRFFFPVLDAFARALPHTLRDTAAPVGTRVSLVVTGEAGGVWTAERTGGDWTLVTGDASRAGATLTIDQDLAWRLFTKGITPDEASHQAVISGDGALAAALLQMVSIIA
ncbi:MAG: maleylpyruvate isomerase family mycothiol-dependent enzyme [Thermomicrobiales bacterium]